MKSLIIHADDFGLTPEVSRGILDACSKGIATSTSIMVNTPYLDEVLPSARSHPDLDFGIHVNLTHGSPLSPPDRIPSLVNKDGRFFGGPRKFLEDLSALRIEDIETEARAQLELGLSLGLAISHLDSHHHVHRNPYVLTVLTGLAKRYGLALRSLDSQMRRRLTLAGVRTPLGFSAEFFGEENLRLVVFRRILKSFPSGISEFCCHPGYSDKLLSEVSSYSDERQLELTLLTGKETAQLVRDLRCKLVDFRVLQGVGV
ncbi:MAG: ChbG/HpnK family deacetylase [Armatimonadetes bacterium]|nr:ChbG/HpnK family deacetylase [Armatimonadota bacterium]